MEFNTLSIWREIVSVHWSQWCNSSNWTYLYDADGFLHYLVLIRVLEPISVPNESRASVILIKFHTLSSWRDVVRVHWSQWCNSLNWTYLYDADGFLQFRVMIRVLEPISVPNESRDSFILIEFNTLSIWREIVSVHCSQWCNSSNWTYLYDADGFLHFLVLIRVLEPISVPNESRASLILIKFHTLSPQREIVSVHWSQWCNSLNWTYLYDADGFLQFQVLIRVLEPISIRNESRDSFLLIEFNTLSIWREIVSVHWSQWCNSLNWKYLYDADGFPQFRVLILVLELISVPNESRESCILIEFNILSSWRDVVRVHWSQWCNSLNWKYLYDADGFPQFRVLILVLELISVPNESRESCILIEFNILSSWRDVVRVHWSQWCNSLNWTYLYDADGFLQFRVMIRVLEPISVPNESRDSFILIKFNTLSIWREIVSVHWSQWCNSLNWTYLYDADGFLQFRVLIRVLEPISIRNESRDSFLLIEFNTLSIWREIVSVHWSQWCNSLNWTYLYDADGFLVLTISGFDSGSRILISVPNESRESCILIEFNILSSWREVVRVHWSQWCNSLNWTYLYDADGFLQFRVMFRVLEPISVPNESRDSFFLIKFNTLSTWREIVSVHWSQWCNSLNWTYLYDADGFLQFRVLIRVLEPISIRNESRDSFLLIEFNTLSIWREIVSVHWSQWCNSSNWTYLYDADGFLRFLVLIRVLEPISVPNESRASFILIKFHTLSPQREIVSVHWSQWCNSLNWTYLYDADGFLQFRVLILVLELISVPNESRESCILIEFNTLSSWREVVRVHWILWCNSLNWTYLYDADGFLQFRVLIRVLEPISIRNESRDSFLLIEFNTLSIWREIVSVHWS